MGGKCLQFSICQGVYCDWTKGLCASDCDANAPCGAGLECIELSPCSATGNLSPCGRRCLPTCDASCAVGGCRSVSNIAGETVKVCDLRQSDGTACRTSGDCQSGRCTERKCVPASGAPNGGPCTTPADCGSGNCQNGVCRGPALIGDPCVARFDCSAGFCCDSGPSQHTCQTG
jgi:hypothetical protein